MNSSNNSIGNETAAVIPTSPTMTVRQQSTELVIRPERPILAIDKYLVSSQNKKISDCLITVGKRMNQMATEVLKKARYKNYIWINRSWVVHRIPIIAAGISRSEHNLSVFTAEAIWTVLGGDKISMNTATLINYLLRTEWKYLIEPLFDDDQINFSLKVDGFY